MSFRASADRRALVTLYKELDALLAPFSCAGSTGCCIFSNTGREPYPTALELAEVRLAIAERGGARALLPAGRRRRLRIAGDPRCPLLTTEGRCRIYPSRPFGCRTHFCGRRAGPGEWPRRAILDLGARLADLSARAFPRDPRARPLRNALARLT